MQRELKGVVNPIMRPKCLFWYITRTPYVRKPDIAGGLEVMRCPAIAGDSHELKETMGSQSQLEALMKHVCYGTSHEHTVWGCLALQEASK